MRRRDRKLYTPAAAVLGLLAMLIPGAAPLRADVVRPLPYDLLYVRSPYFGAGTEAANSAWPDTVRPLTPDPGAQLVRLKRDGTREVLFPLERYRSQIGTPAGRPLSAGSVSDPNVSFNGRWVLFTWYHDLTSVNPQRGDWPGPHLSTAGADLYKLNLVSGQLVRLTTQMLTPNTGNGGRFTPGDPNGNHPRIGVFNTGGTWAPGGRIVFTSNRNNFLPPKAMNSGQRVMQLFVMDEDGANVEQIGHLNLAMALHPQVLLDGRIAFSSWEEQGLRDARLFPLWVIGPDGRGWMGLSGFSEPALVHHFMAQMPGGDLVVTRYYNLNNNGFGDLVRYPLDPAGPDFGSPDADFSDGKIPFQRQGQVRLTPFTTPDDFPAPCPGWEDNPYASSGSEGPPPCAGTDRRGKFTHPAATPNAAGDPARADLLAVYAPGPANHNGIYVSLGTAFPRYHGEIVLIPDGAPIPVPPAGSPGRPPQLVTVLAEDGWNLQWPRPVVSWQHLHGMAGPAAWPELSDDAIRAERLTPGEPFGLLGSASLLWRDTAPSLGIWRDDRDPFNTGDEAPFRWVRQGGDAGIYRDDDIWAVRILLQLPATDRTYPDNGRKFYVAGGERMRILGEIPVRKPGAARLLRPDGSWEDDTSFLARIPADVSVTFQTLDRRGMVLNMAQTWHQVRAGEARYDCGGCHAHSKEPLDFEATAAARPGYAIPDLARSTPLLALSRTGQPGVRTVAAHQVTVEWFRNVEPILEKRCASCHGGASPAAGLPLSRSAPRVARDGVSWPGAYFRLVLDTFAELLRRPAGRGGAVVCAAAHPLPARFPVAAEPADVEGLGRAPGRRHQRGADRRPRLRPLFLPSRGSRRAGYAARGEADPGTLDRPRSAGRPRLALGIRGRRPAADPGGAALGGSGAQCRRQRRHRRPGDLGLRRRKRHRAGKPHRHLQPPPRLFRRRSEPRCEASDRSRRLRPPPAPAAPRTPRPASRLHGHRARRGRPRHTGGAGVQAVAASLTGRPSYRRQ